MRVVRSEDRCRRPRSRRTGSGPAPAGGRAWRTPKVTVRRASIAAPGTAPVSAATPEGRSTATIGIGPDSPRAKARSATGSGSPGRPPMPSTPSTARSKSSRVRWPSAPLARGAPRPARRMAIDPAAGGSAARPARGRAARPGSARRSPRRPAAGQPGPGEQRVPAVVARSHHHQHLGRRRPGRAARPAPGPPQRPARQPHAASGCRSSPSRSIAAASRARTVSTPYASMHPVHPTPRRSPRPTRCRRRGTG